MTNAAPTVQSIEIRNLKPTPPTFGNFKATFTVSLRGTEINECRIIQQDGHKWFFTGPQRGYKNREGATNYVQLIKFSDDLHGKIRTFLEPMVAELLQPPPPKPSGMDEGMDDIPF